MTRTTAHPESEKTCRYSNEAKSVSGRAREPSRRKLKPLAPRRDYQKSVMERRGPPWTKIQKKTGETPDKSRARNPFPMSPVSPPIFKDCKGRLAHAIEIS